MNLENYKLMTHKNCMDGSATAIAFIAAGGKKENIVFTNPNHEEADEKLEKILQDGNNDILIADCSISYDFAKEIDKGYNNLNIKLLDHHKTALPLAEFKWCNINKENSDCGSRMLFKYLLNNFAFGSVTYGRLNCYIKLITLVDDHDRWCQNYPESKDLATLHSIIGQNAFIERFRTPRYDDLFTSEERFLIDLEHKKMMEMIEDKKRAVKDYIVTKTINGKDYRFGFIGGAAKFTSEIAEALYADPTLNLDAVVLVSAEAISLRCKKGSDLDVSKIAKEHGGGGHQGAAGFPLTNLLGSSLLEFVMTRMRTE
jgi:oligoribonuclease NrnB/cAMP/cGMP phosphodiesterase (DHH superfamily)